MCCSGDRQHVMLTDRVYRNLASDHEFVVSLVVRESGGGERCRGEEFGIGSGHTSWGVLSSLRIEWYPECVQERTRCARGRGDIRCAGVVAGVWRVTGPVGVCGAGRGRTQAEPPCVAQTCSL